MMPWQRYNFMVSLTHARRSDVNSSRESAIQRYACMRTAGPKQYSGFHQ